MSKKPTYGLPMKGSVKLVEIPIDAHPDVVRGDSPLLEPARAAQRSVYEVWTKVREAQQTVTDKKRLAEVAQRAVERSLNLVDQKLDRLRQSRAQLDARVDAAVRPKTHDAVAVEIRGYMQRAPEAFGKVAEMIRKGDRRTTAAVLTAPAYLSGLTDEQHDTLLNMARSVFCPEDVTTLGHLDRAISRAERSAQQLSSTIAPLVRQWRGNDDKALEELESHEK